MAWISMPRRLTPRRGRTLGFSKASTIWSTIYANRSGSDDVYLQDQAVQCKVGPELRLLGVTNHAIRRLIKAAVLPAAQVVPGAPHQIRADDLASEPVKTAAAPQRRFASACA